MTANDNTPRQPDEDEPIEELLGDVLDLVDETVARITDAEVDEHLRKALSQTGNTGQANSLWLGCLRDLGSSDLNRQIGAPAKSPVDDAVANLMATLRGNTKLPWDLVLLSQRIQEETLDAARKQAEQIVAAARDEGLNEAAKMVREAREQADQIISEAREQAAQVVSEARSTAYHIISGARGEAGQIITATRSSQPSQPEVRDFGVCIPVACDALPAQPRSERDWFSYRIRIRLLRTGYDVRPAQPRSERDWLSYRIRLLCTACAARPAQTRSERDRLGRYLLDLLRHNAEFWPDDVASWRTGRLSDPVTCQVFAPETTYMPVKTDSGMEQRNPLVAASIGTVPAMLRLHESLLAKTFSLPKTMFDAIQTPALPAPAFPINQIDAAASALSELITVDTAGILGAGCQGTVAAGTLMTSPNHEPGPLWEWRKTVLPDKCAENEPTLELEP